VRKGIRSGWRRVVDGGHDGEWVRETTFEVRE